MNKVLLEAIEINHLDSARKTNGFKLTVPGYRPYYHEGWVNRASMDDMEFLTDVMAVMEADWIGYEKNALGPLFKCINVNQPDMLIGAKNYKYEEYGYITKHIKYKGIV